MTQLDEDRALHAALRGLGDQLDDSDTASAVETAVRSGKRRTVARRSAAGVAGLAAAAVVAMMAVTALRSATEPVFQPVAGAPAAVHAADVTLDCGNTGVNSGTIDGAGTMASPLAAAERWSIGSGFAKRFPRARLQILEGQQSLVVVAKDADGLARAALQFDRVSGGWAWSTAQYC